jgi:threonine dehydrogenase-like Zn-dependent dehydrogenase
MMKNHYRGVISGPGKFHLEKVETPRPIGNEVLVRLEGCGVCASTLPLWEGRSWVSYPLEAGAPGHEGWGIVEEIGAGVESVRVGDRVGILSKHAFSEVELVHVGLVVRLPSNLAGMEFPGEALARAMIIFQRADIHAGQRVAVIGAGFLGSLLVQLIAAAGATAIAISKRGSSLESARLMGAKYLIPFSNSYVVLDEVGRVTAGEFCERVIEATGYQEALDLAGELSAIGGKLLIAGVHRDGLRRVNLQLWNTRGLDVVTAYDHEPEAYLGGMRAAILALGEGRLEPTPLYTHRFRLPDLPDAFELLVNRTDGFMKSLMTYD